MAHYVICPYCGVKFNRDKEPYVAVSARRYAHPQCAEEHEKNKTQEERDLEALEKYIMNLFDEPYINAKIKKQIESYQKEYQYSYSGMLKSLVWFYEIKGNSIEKSNHGIGIIPFIYNEAKMYYYNIYLAKLANQSKDINLYKPIVKEVTIAAPSIKIKPTKLFMFEEDINRNDK